MIFCWIDRCAWDLMTNVRQHAKYLQLLSIWLQLAISSISKFHSTWIQSSIAIAQLCSWVVASTWLLHQCAFKQSLNTHQQKIFLWVWIVRNYISAVSANAPLHPSEHCMHFISYLIKGIHINSWYGAIKNSLGMHLGLFPSFTINCITGTSWLMLPCGL